MKSLISGCCVIGLLLGGPLIGPAAAKGTATRSDSALDRSIEHRMKADPSLKRYDIDVSVKDHVATLTGTVATDRERARAVRLASIKGVTRVDNQIAVNPDRSA